uniref:Uncharacterized protein n=1 Tax=Cacopsylla melanoneura TaxID=428564 RepID=A0A8D9E9D0_9HEMI
MLEKCIPNCVYLSITFLYLSNEKITHQNNPETKSDCRYNRTIYIRQFIKQTFNSVTTYTIFICINKVVLVEDKIETTIIHSIMYSAIVHVHKLLITWFC